MANLNKSPSLTPVVVPSSLPLAVDGIRLAAGASGSRYRGRDDTVLIELASGSETCCLYTQNKFCAAPVTVARRHQRQATPRFLIINAGNANAGTGVAGETAAVQVCAAVAAAANCQVAAVLPYSTGVIGQQLLLPPLEAVIPSLYQHLNRDGWAAAAYAIMTTDTRPKMRSATVKTADCLFTVTGMTKGSGMIKPDMATMLAYVTTDAAVSPELLPHITRRAAAASFNCITVDGDTSTNDAFALIATGRAANPVITSLESEAGTALTAAIEYVCVELAKDIIRDGEGATKFITVKVAGGSDAEDCRRVAYAVAESPLVKTALFASDANWGRILAAIGRAGTRAMNISDVAISISGVAIVRGGNPVAGYEEAVLAREMQKNAIEIAIEIGAGAYSTVVWTCDFSFDYVKINAEYRS